MSMAMTDSRRARARPEKLQTGAMHGCMIAHVRTICMHGHPNTPKECCSSVITDHLVVIAFSRAIPEDAP